MRLQRWLAAMVFVAALPVSGSAQSDQGKFAGTVRDTSGGFVAGATVTVKNERTGEERTQTTAGGGTFLIPNLKPSTYTVRAMKEGFAPVEYAQMPIAVGQELHLDFEFKPAGVQEEVTVVGAAPVLDLSSARMGVNVSQRVVDGLPVNGRQMSQLLLQAPGSQNAGDGSWQDIRFSGRANEQNVIKYDGVEGSAIIDASPGNANGENRTPFRLQASLENVQEFRVESSSYPAEYGTGTGGQVSVITKSGSNTGHGAVFEYLRNDRLDARNHFDSLRANDDSVISDGPKSILKQHQYGFSLGGPIVKDRAFMFGSYEGYRMDAGKNLVEGIPSAAAWGRAVPAILALRPGFMAPGAVIVPGVSTNPDIDIAQLQDIQKVRENAFSTRVDLKFSSTWSFYTRVFHDRGTSDAPDGVTGRRIKITDRPSNAVFNLQGLFGNTINEFKVGYNAAPSTYGGFAPAGFEGILFSLTGTVAAPGIPGQAGASVLASPGQLVRVNSSGNGAAAPYDPYSLALSDTVSRTMGNHYLKMGADARMIRMSTDQVGGITYTFANITNFLANTATSVQLRTSLSDPSPFHNGATGPKHIKQDYYVGFVQDEWHLRSNLTMNLGLRYDYYAPLREADNRIVKFNIDTGTLDPDTTPFYESKKTNFQPRLSASYSPTRKTAIRAGMGVFVGPGQTEDQIQPIEAERISTTVTGGSFPVNSATIISNFTNTPLNRQFQPRAYANEYTLPETVYEYTTSVQQEIGAGMAASVAYIGAQGRNLFLRSIANRTVGVQTNGAAAAFQVREFDILNCADGRVLNGTVSALTSSTLCPGSTIASIQRPYAEIDYKTSGGYDSYNSMQLTLNRRSLKGVTLNAQYTLGSSRGNTGGSNEAATAGNNARTLEQFEYENGYNNFDVRHTFNLSALYTIPGSGPLAGGWSLGGIINARSGVPVPVLVGRSDIVYVDGAGIYWNNAAADRTAVINMPGGNASRGTARPDLIPGVDPFIKSGGLLFLNPAAFATPKPGTFGNLERNSIHGPNFRQVDVVISKKVGGRRTNGEFRVEIFNLFDTVNFALPPGTLPNALPGANESPTQANRVQPGRPYSTASAGSWGILSSSVSSTTGLGTNRQVQLAFRLTF